MCFFTSRRDPYVRDWDEPPPHRSNYSAHRGGSARVASLPAESFSRSRHGSREWVDADRREFVRERRSREYITYPTRVSREIEYYPARRSLGSTSEGPRLIEYRAPPPEETTYKREMRYVREG
jgi:hypothetical protein